VKSVCGIAGIYDLAGGAIAPPLLMRMTDALAHRGPDGVGHYADGPIGLAHRRLAIIDLSPAGSQPMANETGDVVLTFNGEIYNYLKLRLELEALGYRFRSQCDTEVLLHAYEAWGEGCLERFNGMFAFAVWDARSEQLFLARDRFGIKPLYYYHKGDLFLFASEIKALLTHPTLSVRVCPEALGEYFTFQNIFSDRTLFEGVRLLPPGCWMRVEAAGRPALQQQRYWDYHFRPNGAPASADEAAEELGRLFEQAVTRQLVADVPVGAYLSGGLDSGSITSVAARHLGRLHTFTGGFDLSSASGMELGFDERPAAEMMANLFKTEHYEMVLHAGDMEHILPELIWHLEDLRVGQCYPNYYIARLASKFVKVVLSGAGGDELFAGYPWRYYRGLHVNGPESYFRAYYEYWQRLLPDGERSRFFTRELANALNGHSPAEAFRQVFDGADVHLASIEDKVNASLYFELRTFLHGLFIVEDKLSMAHSLETRVPFLDNDLVDFALRVPPRFKLHDLLRSPEVDEDETWKKVSYRQGATADGKQILRRAINRLVPASITARAKQGFSAPDASWFRGESIQYVERLLLDRRARLYEFVSPEYIRKVLHEHVSAKVNHRLLIWSLLSFEWWLRKFVA
jgi:asparagine synthase (glutamine-hydrolysing)